MLHFALTALAFSANSLKFDDVCASASDCSDCIAKVDQGCGWCAPHEVVYTDGTKGNRCANANDPKKWFCLGKMMTDQCVEGYVCTGAPSYKCELSGRPGEGTPDSHACIDGCSEPPKWKCNSGANKCEVCTSAERDLNPDCMDDVDTCNDQCIVAKTYKCDHTQATCVECSDSDDPAFCKGKDECDGKCTASYQCEFPTDKTTDPQCKPCTSIDGKGCYSSKSACQEGDGQQYFGCNWQYECQFAASGPTCAKTAHGIPKLEWCTEQCVPTYTCDEDAMTCKLSNSTGGTKDKTSCDAGCPSVPQNNTVPYELRGVWRGFAIEQTYSVGEWQANVTANSTEVILPDGTVYFSGLTSTKEPDPNGNGVGMLLVESVKGKLIGKVKLLYSYYGLEPELSYVALALDESKIATPPATYDAAMSAASNKVVGFYKCKSDANNCRFSLAPLVEKVPAHLIWTRGMSLSLLGKYKEPSAVTGDKCNAFSSCSTCIGATAGGLACGWCTEPVIYGNSSAASYQCAGWESGAAHGWKCYGQFRTATCTDYCCNTNGGCSECAEGVSGFPTKDMCDASCSPQPPSDFPCDFDGIYRGLEIDLGYKPGEWLAHFNKTSGNATFKYFGFRSAPGTYEYSGALRCTPDSDKVPLAQQGIFSLTLTNKTVLHGRYTTGGNQAETEGLNWALAEKGSTIAPISWDAAMLGVNATVFGYTKCASYKAGVCKFHI